MSFSFSAAFAPEDKSHNDRNDTEQYYDFQQANNLNNEGDIHLRCSSINQCNYICNTPHSRYSYGRRSK
jgi:hypothetical protein